jgi:hypothetical protein
VGRLNSGVRPETEDPPMPSPRANTLFHFTRNLEFLQGILANGFFPRYCLEDTRWIGVDFTPVPMVCFCDIPISRVSEHTDFYGSYGIGMTKDWALRNQLQPLIYTPPSGAVTQFLNDLIDLDEGKIDIVNEHIPVYKHFRKITTLVKPLSGNMQMQHGLVEKDFYQENEWRYVPEEFRSINSDEFESQRDRCNSEIANAALRFTSQDVRYLFVKTEGEIPALFDYIHQNLGAWPHNDLKILTSRITSLETIYGDV